MPIAGWIAARTICLLARADAELAPDAGGGFPPSIARRAELAPAFRRSRRESERLTTAVHRSTASRNCLPPTVRFHIDARGNPRDFGWPFADTTGGRAQSRAEPGKAPAPVAVR